MPFDLTGTVDANRDSRQTAPGNTGRKRAKHIDRYSYHSPDYVRQQNRKICVVEVNHNDGYPPQRYVCRAGNVGSYHLAFWYADVKIIAKQ